MQDSLSCALDLGLGVGKRIDVAAKWGDLVLVVGVGFDQRSHVVAGFGDVVVVLCLHY